MLTSSFPLIVCFLSLVLSTVLSCHDLAYLNDGRHDDDHHRIQNVTRKLSSSKTAVNGAAKTRGQQQYQGYLAFLLLCEPDLNCIPLDTKSEIIKCLETGLSSAALYLYKQCTNQGSVTCDDVTMTRTIKSCLKLQSNVGNLITDASRYCIREKVSLGHVDCYKINVKLRERGQLFWSQRKHNNNDKTSYLNTRPSFGSSSSSSAISEQISSLFTTSTTTVAPTTTTLSTTLSGINFGGNYHLNHHSYGLGGQLTNEQQQQSIINQQHQRPQGASNLASVPFYPDQASHPFNNPGYHSHVIYTPVPGSHNHQTGLSPQIGLFNQHAHQPSFGTQQQQQQQYPQQLTNANSNYNQQQSPIKFDQLSQQTPSDPTIFNRRSQKQRPQPPIADYLYEYEDYDDAKVVTERPLKVIKRKGSSSASASSGNKRRPRIRTTTQSSEGKKRKTTAVPSTDESDDDYDEFD